MEEPDIPKKRPYKPRTPARTRASTTRIPDTWSGLDLSNQGIRNLSKHLFSLSFLTELYLNNNELESIPVSITGLTNLEIIDLSCNRLKTVIPEIGRMIYLRELNLGENYISCLPMGIGTLYQLENLNLNDNPLIEPFATIYKNKGGLGLITFCKENNTGYEEPSERNWVDTDIYTDKKKKMRKGISYTLGETISVATYNILCSHYATNQAFGYVPSWVLQWNNRREAIVQEIVLLSSDILCLQEVETSSYIEYFREELEIQCGYDSLFYPKTRAKSMSSSDRMQVDGCATFWNKKRFTLVEQKCLEFSRTVLLDKRFNTNEDVINRNLNRDNIALVVVLERVGLPGQIIIVNAHIHWDPEYKDVKLFQTILILEELKKLRDKYPFAGIVLVGDFNTLPSSPVYDLVCSGRILPFNNDFGTFNYHPFSTGGFSHELGFSDAYADQDVGLTNFTPHFKGVIDYIFYDDRLVLRSVLSTLDREYCERVVGLPSIHCPSDHILLASKFTLKGKLNKKT
ncbi:putative glucose-repressible alcohol dehydrogenase transcriptional effector like protein [Astathelohania contejeani]|uniref:poly(A)-specific ribonuclease n=1 Tax=Astathelohania contejeani TaxID=164912 RepID=A0ABQ7I1W6_9MICR|nr:putative glucose-repressible alcohol dehydrogenase transcriptional effector like protein [Thelohania contejeani]